MKPSELLTKITKPNCLSLLVNNATEDRHETTHRLINEYKKSNVTKKGGSVLYILDPIMAGYIAKSNNVDKYTFTIKDMVKRHADTTQLIEFDKGRSFPYSSISVNICIMKNNLTDKELERLIKKHKADLVFINSFSKLFNHTSNGMVDVLSIFKDLCIRYQTNIITYYELSPATSIDSNGNTNVIDNQQRVRDLVGGCMYCDIILADTNRFKDLDNIDADIIKAKFDDNMFLSIDNIITGVLKNTIECSIKYKSFTIGINVDIPKKSARPGILITFDKRQTNKISNYVFDSNFDSKDEFLDGLSHVLNKYCDDRQISRINRISL